VTDTVSTRGPPNIRFRPMRKRHHRAPHDVFPTEAEIAQRAYELCFVNRRLCVDHHGYLQLAEQELLDRGARRAMRLASGDGRSQDGD
jgi:hypothetical protein